MGEKVSLNGRLIEADQASISVFDGGLQHAAGLFETMRAYGGVIFRLDAHLQRLIDSARKLALPISLDRDRLAEDCRRVLTANGLTGARMRLTCTIGSIRRREPEQDGREPTVLIAATPFEPYPSDYYQKGMMVIVSPYRQQPGPLAGHKWLGYLPRLMVLDQARRSGAGEALWYTPAGHLAEGCISNVFLVKAGVLLTPPLDTPILPGITRQAVIELAEDAGIEVRQRPLTVEDMLAAEEVFLTNSTMELMPVTHIERHGVGNEKPGPVTCRLHQLYRQLVGKECGLSA